MTKMSRYKKSDREIRSKIYYCKTYHTRFFPKTHSFEYPVLYFGVDLDELSNKESIIWKNYFYGISKLLFGYNQKYTLFGIKDYDYIDKSFNNITSIKEKLFSHIEKKVR